MSVTKTYAISSIQQLVDLNGDLTNFKLSFSAKSHDGSHFYALVVDQTQLDENPSLEFRNAEGEISGDIEMANNIYQNYFLVLKSKDDTKACNVEVSITRTEIAPSVQPVQPVQQLAQSLQQAPTNPQSSPQLTTESSVKSSTNWKIIGVIVVLILAGGYYYYYVHKSSTPATTVSGVVAPVVVPVVVPVVAPVVAPVVPTFTSQPAVHKVNSDLLARLNSLPLY